MKPVRIGPHNKRGPKKLHEKYPEIASVLKRFLATSGVHAEKNRTQYGYIGVKLKAIRKHLLEQIPHLLTTGFSPQAVRHLLVPPNKGNRNAVHYHSVVNAKVPRKQNTIMGGDPDSRWARANMRNWREFRNSSRPSGSRSTSPT